MNLEQMNVTAKDLSSYLLTLPAFDYDTHSEDCKLMSQKRRELEEASDITDIINIVAREYASFLEYDIFQDIVGEYKLDQSQKPLQYTDDLKAYIEKHRISEFMKINPALERYSGAKELILKFDEHKLLDSKIVTLLDLKNAVAAILGIQASALRLLSAREGCLVVEFLIPEFIANSIFTDGKKLSLKQEKNFQKLSVLWLKCTGYEFKFQDTGVQG